MIDDSAVERELTETVRGIDGVLDIYPVAPALLAAASQVWSAAVGSAAGAAAAGSAAGLRVVSVSRESRSPTVTIRAHIGVDAERAAPDVTRDVSAALSAEAARLLGPEASVSISVKVSSIG